MQSQGGAAFAWGSQGATYSPLPIRAGTLELSGAQEELSPRSPRTPRSIPSQGGARLACSSWGSPVSASASPLMESEAGCDLSRFAAPIGMSVPLLLYVALWIVYFTSRNPAVRPTLLRVLLCCTAVIVAVPIFVFSAKAIMGSRVASGLKALSDLVLKMESRVDSVYVDIHEGIICIDGLEMKNPQNREWRSPYLLTAKRIRCHVLFRDFAKSKFRHLTVQELNISGVELMYEKTFDSSNVNDVLNKIAEVKDNLKPKENEPPRLTFRRVVVEDIAVRLQGLVAAMANIATADLRYEDFSEEVGPVGPEFLIVLLLKTFLKSAVSNVLGLNAFRSLVGYASNEERFCALVWGIAVTKAAQEGRGFMSVPSQQEVGRRSVVAVALLAPGLAHAEVDNPLPPPVVKDLERAAPKIQGGVDWFYFELLPAIKKELMDVAMEPESLAKLARPALPGAPELRAELHEAVQRLSFAELHSSTQWASELLAALPRGEVPMAMPAQSMSSSVLLAKAHFGMREYSRAAHALQSCPTHGKELHSEPWPVFFRCYALYLAGEKRREEDAAEVSDPAESSRVRNTELKTLEEDLSALHHEQKLDGLGLYVYGIVLKGLELKEDARRVLLESVHAFPCNWSAWLDIISISADLDDVSSCREELRLPLHWMSLFFEAAMQLELQRNESARDLYVMLRASFPESAYIASQIATCFYNLRNFDASQLAFEELRRRDPYRLSSLDTYSNILFVKEQAAALSHLARQAVKIDKYTPEACIIIGNYYSLKGEHEKAVIYFRRALALNCHFTPAWILMGHEFMEMKNTAAAIDAYRTAVTINRRDYRAWYGLGQTYELLSLHFYALFYYRRAMSLRPDDARMWCAMAQCYDHMDRKTEALKCYEKAHRCGDLERMALPRLARLHRDHGDQRQAAAYYSQMLELSGHARMVNAAAGVRPDPATVSAPLRPLGPSLGLASESVEALRFLMNFFAEEGRFAEAEACATQLLDTAGSEKALGSGAEGAYVPGALFQSPLDSEITFPMNQLASANVEADEDGWTTDIRDFQKACIDMSDAVGANDWPQADMLSFEPSH
ncbi:APC8 [Symbiodinium natans]|uniref:APC8 protein n=1 Tax=Symbiodinium natans TaxID=878477 RepID=A0A812TZF2_9DINO|nr:APC8 [Symbiodinium natans]